MIASPLLTQFSEYYCDLPILLLTRMIVSDNVSVSDTNLNVILRRKNGYRSDQEKKKHTNL